MKVTYTEARGDFIAGSKRGYRSVKIGIIQPIPEPDVFNCCMHFKTGSAAYLSAFCITYGDCDGFRAIGEGFYRYLTFFVTLYGLCCDLDTVTAKIIQVEMVLVDDQQIHIPVDTAVESEVSLLWVDTVINAVVNPYLHSVFFLQQCCDIRTKGGITAVMSHDSLSIEFNFCRSIDTVKFKVYALLFYVEIRFGKLLFIKACSSAVVIAAVLTVNVVPRMGEIKYGLHTIQIGKLPLLVQIDNMTHLFTSFRFSMPESDRCLRFPDINGDFSDEECRCSQSTECDEPRVKAVLFVNADENIYHIPIAFVHKEADCNTGSCCGNGRSKAIFFQQNEHNNCNSPADQKAEDYRIIAYTVVCAVKAKGPVNRIEIKSRCKGENRSKEKHIEAKGFFRRIAHER